MEQYDRLHLLKLNLERDRDGAWERARYERDQRDQYGSRLRFGLVAMNAASLVTIINAPGLFAGLTSGDVLAAAAFFLVGTIGAGYSLVAQQTHLIDLTGNATARALTLDRAVTLAEFPAHTPENEKLGEAMEQASRLSEEMFGYSKGALRLQWLSMSSWIGGVAYLAITSLSEILPTWPWW